MQRSILPLKFWKSRSTFFLFSGIAPIVKGFSLFVILWFTHANVHWVSSTTAGVTAQIIAVNALPPSEDCKMRVNLLSRKLMNFWGLLWLSLRFIITNPKADSERLMCRPSLKRSPVAPVCPALSDPARSTRFNCDTWTAPSTSFCSRLSIIYDKKKKEVEKLKGIDKWKRFKKIEIKVEHTKRKIVWLLLLLSFMFVSPVRLFISPFCIILSTLLGQSMYSSLHFTKAWPVFGSSFILRRSAVLSNRSLIRSLYISIYETLQIYKSM